MPKRLHIRVCQNCGKEYETHNTTRTCSLACREELKAKNRARRSITGECPICGKVGLLQWKAYDVMVCSQKCRGIVNQRKWINGYYEKTGIPYHAAYRLDAPSKKVKPQITCEVCGKTVPGRHCNQKYCSKQCKTKAMHFKKRDEVAAKRANVSHCALCGIATDDVLTPRQLNFRSYASGAMDVKMQFDHIVCRVDNGQDDPDNLRGVCWMCNHIRGTMDTVHDDAVAAASKAFWTVILRKS